jgi:hypothetical protein
MSDRVTAWLLACALAALPAGGTSPSPTTRTAGCLAAGDGYLRARIRGALDLDLDWKDAQMQCEGAPRPRARDDRASGVRVSIAGPLRGDGRRIRLVFGIADLAEGASGTTLRTNVTLLFEGENRLYATLGDDKCTTDSATQNRVETLGDERAIYRIVARGFCIGPASNPGGTGRVVITSFDFAARVEFGDDDRP